MDFLKYLRARINIKRRFKRIVGYKPNLRKPSSYNEKIQWLKLNHLGNDPKAIARADKYAVREFIQSQGYGDTLVKLYGVWDKPEDINFSALPDQFVLKLNHASGQKFIWLVKDKTTFNRQRFIKEAKLRMRKAYGRKYGEFHYTKMPRKIIAEEYLTDNERPLKDYKFYCFHGRVVFFSVEEGKIEGEKYRDYYNPDWSPFRGKFLYDHPQPSKPYTAPENFAAMIEMAENLSQGFPHIRVDLYNIEGKIYFGELTYSSDNGMTAWVPKSLDYEFGKLMHLDDITH